MNPLKTILYAGAVALCCSCGNYVPKSEYDKVTSQLDSLQESSTALGSRYEEQVKALDNVFVELAALSKNAVDLKADVESGTARISTVEGIENSIDDIKQQLADLDKLTRNNRQLRNAIANLKKVVAEKEAEIAALKKEIESKDKTIASQKNTISSQENTISAQLGTISAQKDELKRMVAEQARMLYQAGADLEEIADASPELSLKKNKAKVKNWTREMYESALVYYNKALETGYAEAESAIARVSSKLAEM